MRVHEHMRDRYELSRAKNADTEFGRDTFLLAEQWGDRMEAQQVIEPVAALEQCPAYSEATGGMVADARTILRWVWVYGDLLSEPRAQA